MAFIRQRRNGTTTYYQLVESYREGGKVRQRILNYFPSRTDAELFAERQGLEMPKPAELLDAPTAKRLEDKLAKLNALRPLPQATLESLQKKFEVEMTYNSNAIEGNLLSLKETFLVLEKGITIGGKSVHDHLEATNHKEALEFLTTLADKRKAITEADVLELHRIILDKIRPDDAGQYRHVQVLITESAHRPPNWHEVPEQMKGVIAELNSKAKGANAIISATKVHHSFVFVHPFVDGNGRVARLLTNLRLMRAGFPPVILHKKVRTSYYRALEKADKGDLAALTAITARDAEQALDLWLSAAP